MNIVKSGPSLQVYGNEVQTFKQIPTGCYDVTFDKMSGFSLREREDLEVKEEKIYGNSLAKVEKVLKSFEVTNRNFGIILSGPKGIGKSLFARLLSKESMNKDIPVISVSYYVPGIANFLSSIKQEVVVIFDEFEKTFCNEDTGAQNEMLPLFDGMDNGKKLFVITCNDVYKLNTCLLNRPGRFHYHFKVTVPTGEEIEEYLKDKLLEEYYDEIPKIKKVALTSEITYDCLRAIVFELNQGYGLKETLNDLNLKQSSKMSLETRIKLSNGEVYTETRSMFDLTLAGANYVRCRKENRQNKKIPSDVYIGFSASKLKNIDEKTFYIDVEDIVEVEIDEDFLWDRSIEEEEKENLRKEVRNLKVTEVTFTIPEIKSGFNYQFLV